MFEAKVLAKWPGISRREGLGWKCLELDRFKTRMILKAI
jgi:hypothetical protein